MRAILVFDGDCGMCTTCADLVVRRLRGSPDDYDVAPSQRLDLPSLGLTRQECDESLQWVGADGAIASGHDAVAAVLIASRWWVRPAGVALRLPGLHALAGLTYRWVAGHRQAFPGGTPACSLPTHHEQGES